jgi:hypothetical protein
MIARSRAASDAPRVAFGLYRLGVLHLDPWTAGRRPVSHAEQIQEARRRAVAWRGRFTGFAMPASDRFPPETDVALARAVELFRESAAIGAGRDKGLTLKALVQAIEWQLQLAERAPPTSDAAALQVQRLGELRRVGEQALALLDPDEAPQHRMNVLATLARIGDGVDAIAEVERIFAIPWPARVRQLGPRGAIDLALQAAQLLQRSHPLRALAILDEPEVDRLAREAGGDARLNRWILQLQLLHNAHGHPVPARPQSVAQTAEELRARSARERGTPESLAVDLLMLAMVSTNVDEEALGLKLLDEAAALAPGLVERYAEAIAFQRANLSGNLGASLFQARQIAAAVWPYTEATLRFLELAFPDAALTYIGRIADLCRAPDAIPLVVRALEVVAPPLEAAAGERATELLQSAFRETLDAMARSGKMDRDDYFHLVRAAKGQRLSALVAQPPSPAWRPRGAPPATERAAADDGEPDATSSGAPAASADELLVGYLRPGVPQAGDDAVERLANERHRFDVELVRQLADAAVTDVPTPLTLTALRAALDERTAVLDYYLGSSDDGQTLTVHLLLVTRDDVQLQVIKHAFPSSTVVLGFRDQEVVMHPLALLIAGLREQLVRPPGARLVRREAEETLANYRLGLLGHFAERLPRLRERGIDHLCVAPHGALHFLPFHLLGESEHPLADDFIVTTLPSLQLAAPRPPGEHTADLELAVLGLQFAGSAQPLARVLAECEAVAKSFGVAAQLDGAATRAAFVEALGRARRVHLSTHGRHYPAAPSFQQLLLDDGPLFAHELLALDLRHVEVLSLAACETALGRFDLADNLLGLPASFLVAGVQTIVGALWPVSDQACIVFFGAFYRELARRKSRLDSFSIAQRETRAALPQHRDWGAFCLMGAWS